MLQLAAFAGETETFRFEPDPLRIDGQTRRTFHIAIPPGTSVRDAVALTNKTDETRTFRVFAADAAEDPNTGRTAVGSFGATPEAVGSWVEVSQPQVTIAGGQRVVIPFTVERPPDADVGGLGALVAEEVTESTNTGIDVSFRIAILLDARGEPGDDLGIQVESLRIDAPLQLLPRTATLSAVVRNVTSRPAQLTIELSVRSFTGTVWNFEPETYQTTPGERVLLEVPWLTVPASGTVATLSAEVQWAGGTTLADGDATVVMPLWLPLGLVLLTGWLVVREVRRREQVPLAEASEAAPPA